MKNGDKEKPFCGGNLKIERTVFCPSAKEHRSVLRDCQSCPYVDFVDEALVKCNFKEEEKMKWYEDKEYQKMCEGAEEIQKDHVWQLGDFFLHKGHNPPLLLLVAQDDLECGDMECSCCEDKRVWLPTQEDLQEMVKNYQFHIWTGHDGLCLAVSSSNQDQHFIGRKFTSMPKLWLAFYMYECHQKIWDGEKWIKK